MSALKCHRCGWEGEEPELVERLGSPIFYDFVAMNTMKGLEITRQNLECPKCGEILRSHRLVGGMVMDQGF